MKCYNCRIEIAENAIFCPKCGSPQKFTELIKRAKNGDPIAMSQLYKMTYNNVYQTIHTTASLDEDTVFDLIQDTYLKAFRNLSQVNEPEKFRRWIKTIARNVTIDYLRKKRELTFSQMIPIDSNEMTEFEDDRIENIPEIVIDKNETTRLLNVILDGLSDEQRIAITMHYFEELSVKEIANILGVSDGTIKSRLNYGRKKIEGDVKELEKKGTKLYGLAPLPLLLVLFSNQQAYAAEIPNMDLLHSVQQSFKLGSENASFCEDATGTANQKKTRKIDTETPKSTSETTEKWSDSKKIVGVEVFIMQIKSIIAKVTKNINLTGLKKCIQHPHYFLPIGIVLTMVGCFMAMVVSIHCADPYSLYSDLLDNNFFGNLFGLMYQAFSGDDLSGTTLTAGIFVGDFQCNRLAGMSILAWGSASIYFFQKNKLVSGLLTAWSVLFMNIILLVNFWRFNTGDSEFFYTSTECSFGWGYKLFLLGAVMILIGAFKTYELVKLDFPQMFVLNKATKILICGWAIVFLDYVLKVPVPDIITFAIFNVASLYCFVPHLKNGEANNANS